MLVSSHSPASNNNKIISNIVNNNGELYDNGEEMLGKTLQNNCKILTCTFENSIPSLSALLSHLPYQGNSPTLKQFLRNAE